MSFRGDPRNGDMFKACWELILVSKIKENQLLNVRERQLMPKGVFTSFYRTFVVSTESRQRSFDYFNEVYGAAFELLKRLKEENNLTDTERVIEKIKESIIGLENHSKTYMDDTKHTSKIQALIESINADLALYEKGGYF